MQLGRFDIRYDNIGHWPKNIRHSVNLFVILLLLIVTYYFNLQPQFSQLKQAQHKELKLKHMLSQAQQQIISLSSYQKQLNKLYKQSHMLLKPLKRSAAIQLIITLGNDSKLKFTLLQPLSLQTSHSYTILPYTLLLLEVSNKLSILLKG